MFIKKPQWLLKEHEVTHENTFNERRNIIKTLGLVGVSASPLIMINNALADCVMPHLTAPIDKLNTFKQISRYNNYYEFSTNKKAVALLAKYMKVRPWTVEISGEVEKPLTLDIDDILKTYTSEERIYRFRCVEGWSMVIPWHGFQLCELIKRVKPTSKAKYVQFVSKVDDDTMIGLNRTGLKFPYTEALRIDEAMNPLTLLATGLYNQDLPQQNGAPLRLVIPWKYGFKGNKSIVKIIFTEEKPATSWHSTSPSEYGFYGNVNPKVSHPRWSQRKENRIGELRKRKTLMFNGYEEQVAGLYSGMDLEKYY